MVVGIEGLHAAGIIHRNLKPENILIGRDGHIVLSGFGSSKEFSRCTVRCVAVRDLSQAPPARDHMKCDKGLATQWELRHTGMTSSISGIDQYVAPEVVQGLSYGYDVDWWSFGTILYEMLTGMALVSRSTPFAQTGYSHFGVPVEGTG